MPLRGCLLHPIPGFRRAAFVGGEQAGGGVLRVGVALVGPGGDEVQAGLHAVADVGVGLAGGAAAHERERGEVGRALRVLLRLRPERLGLFAVLRDVFAAPEPSGRDRPGVGDAGVGRPDHPLGGLVGVGRGAGAVPERVREEEHRLRVALLRGLAELRDGAGLVLFASRAGHQAAPEVRLRGGVARAGRGPELLHGGGGVGVGPGAVAQAFAERVHRVGVALRDGLAEELDGLRRVLLDRELSGAERLPVLELLDGVPLLGLLDVDAGQRALRGDGGVLGGLLDLV